MPAKVCTLNKSAVRKIMQIKGEVVGSVFEIDLKNIIQLGGMSFVAKVERKMKSFGQIVSYEDMNSSQFYPIGLRILSLLSICSVFNLSNKDVEEMGYQAPNFSFLIKLFVKILVSPEALLKNVKNFWSKHYTVGTPAVLSYDKKNHKMVFELKDFDAHPIFCIFLTGYFRRLVDYTLPGKKAKIVEEKCTFRGGKSHVYKVTWK